MTYNVYQGTIATQPLQYARDWLSGYRGEYLFFRGGEDEYYLVRGDIDFDTLSCSDARVDLIYYAYTDRNGRYYEIATFEHETVSINNSSHVLMYASDSRYPHLISGGEFYALAALLFVSVGFCSLAFSRIFGMVSRK